MGLRNLFINKKTAGITLFITTLLAFCLNFRSEKSLLFILLCFNHRLKLFPPIVGNVLIIPKLLPPKVTLSTLLESAFCQRLF